MCIKLWILCGLSLQADDHAALERPDCVLAVSLRVVKPLTVTNDFNEHSFKL